MLSCFWEAYKDGQVSIALYCTWEAYKSGQESSVLSGSRKTNKDRRARNAFPYFWQANEKRLVSSTLSCFEVPAKKERPRVRFVFFNKVRECLLSRNFPAELGKLACNFGGIARSYCARFIFYMLACWSNEFDGNLLFVCAFYLSANEESDIVRIIWRSCCLPCTAFLSTSLEESMKFPSKIGTLRRGK